MLLLEFFFSLLGDLLVSQTNDTSGKGADGGGGWKLSRCVVAVWSRLLHKSERLRKQPRAKQKPSSLPWCVGEVVPYVVHSATSIGLAMAWDFVLSVVEYSNIPQ